MFESNVTKRGNIMRLLKREGNLSRLILIMFICFATMALLKPEGFLTLDNFISICFQVPEFGVLALAMMLSMISGGIDLSVVGIGNFSAILAATTMVSLVTPDTSEIQVVLIMILALLIAIIAGSVCGAINGFLIMKVGIAPILATLGTMQVFTGAAIIITEGHTIVGLPEVFEVIGNASIWIVPVPFIILIGCILLISVLLSKTSYGLKLLMMGSNPTASKFSGVKNNSIILRTYVLSGLLAAIAGLIISSRTNSANASYGVSYTLQAILLCVLGGVDPNGGSGRVMGVVVAVFTLQFLSSGFNILNFSSFLKDLIWGGVLILVMLLNYFSNTVKLTRKVKNE
jgi:simple sugar transport system permease protein